MIPNFILSNGVKIPCIGNGPAMVAFSQKQLKNTLVNRIYNRLIGHKLLYKNYVDAVSNSFNVGFTLLDNSAAYRNEELIYQAIQKSGVNREELFITTRCSNKAQFKGDIRTEFFKFFYFFSVTL